MSDKNQALTEMMIGSDDCGSIPGYSSLQRKPTIIPLCEFNFTKLEQKIVLNLNELGKFEYDLKSINRKIHININKGAFHISLQKDDKTLYVLDEYENLLKSDWFNKTDYDYVNYNEIYKLIKEDFDNQIIQLSKNKYQDICHKIIPMTLFENNIERDYYTYESVFLNKIIVQSDVIEQLPTKRHFLQIAKPNDIAKYVEDGNIVPYFQFIDTVSKNIKNFYEKVNNLITEV